MEGHETHGGKAQGRGQESQAEEAEAEVTEAYNNLCVEYFPGDPCRCKLTSPLKAYCDTLGRDIEVPTGFVNDLESVPIVKGTNNESGVWHDYFSRLDSDPVVDKTTCAKIYLEFQRYYDALEVREYPDTLWGRIRRESNRVWDQARRAVKASFVWSWPGYFHKHKVMASYEEMSGEKECGG